MANYPGNQEYSFHADDSNGNEVPYHMQGQGQQQNSGGYDPNPYMPEAVTQAHQRTNPRQPDHIAYAVPVKGPIPFNPGPERDWNVGFCDCSNLAACNESFWCWHCQVSRQCNYIEEGKVGIHWALCCGLIAMELLTSGTFLVNIFACYMRQKVRERYNIRGGCCCDCCAAYWCPCCVVNQILREMTRMGEDPGATCGCDRSEDYPENANMY